MKLVLMTGYSGAGKSQALKAFEDLGYETMDNVPLKALHTVISSIEDETTHLAICSDVRSRDFSPEALKQLLAELKNKHDVMMVFLACEPEVLQRRFTETRHRHPLALDRPVMDGILLERRMLHEVRDLADKVIDTSDYGPHDLKRRLMEAFASERSGLKITVISFSYRRGIPRDADLVFDVRFLKNPHYVDTLKPLTGQDAEVAEYIQADPSLRDFQNHLIAWLLPILPRYQEEGKSYLTIAIGCTGGKHRSVYLSEYLGNALKEAGYAPLVLHRELDAS
ncbi:MAG: RNase adapter RapZ [Rickettsiales bacterium]